MEQKVITRIGAYGLFSEGGKILLCRLASIERECGKWTLPGGGVEFGESPQDAAIREIMEETGLEATIAPTAHIDTKLVELSEGGSMHFIRIVFHAIAVGGSLRCEINGSTDRCEWFTLEEAARLPLVDLAEFGLSLAKGV